MNNGHRTKYEIKTEAVADSNSILVQMLMAEYILAFFKHIHFLIFGTESIVLEQY